MSTSFYGKELEALADTPPKPLRKYEIVIDGQTDIVEAHFITRDPGHVCFWARRADDQQDTLVTAINNNLLDEMKEVTE